MPADSGEHDREHPRLTEADARHYGDPDHGLRPRSSAADRTQAAAAAPYRLVAQRPDRDTRGVREQRQRQSAGPGRRTPCSSRPNKSRRTGGTRNGTIVHWPVLARQMEGYAGFLQHTDNQVGRLIDRCLVTALQPLCWPAGWLGLRVAGPFGRRSGGDAGRRGHSGGEEHRGSDVEGNEAPRHGRKTDQQKAIVASAHVMPVPSRLRATPPILIRCTRVAPFSYARPLLPLVPHRPGSDLEAHREGGDPGDRGDEDEAAGHGQDPAQAAVRDPGAHAGEEQDHGVEHDGEHVVAGPSGCLGAPRPPTPRRPRRAARPPAGTRPGTRPWRRASAAQSGFVERAGRHPGVERRPELRRGTGRRRSRRARASPRRSASAQAMNVATSTWVWAWARPCARAASILMALVRLAALACSPFHRVAW